MRIVWERVRQATGYLTEATEHLKERQNRKCKRNTLVTKNGKWGLTDLEKKIWQCGRSSGLDLPHCRGEAG